MDRRITALLALAVAGILWGLTVPLTKLALQWLDPWWLTVARFAVAGPALALIAHRRLRAAATPAVAGWGVVLYGAVFALQNLGVELTSVTHAALIFGTVPVLVAGLSVARRLSAPRPVTWLGLVVAIAGVGVLTRPAGDSSLAGDALVLASAVLSALFITTQPRLLRGRDPLAVTGVQMLAGTLATLPVALLFEGAPASPVEAGPALAFASLASVGSLLPFALYAYAQVRVAPEVAGAFLNLEPLVGAAAGALAFGDPFGPVQAAGVAAIVVGIALSTDLSGRPAPRLERSTDRRSPAGSTPAAEPY